MWATCPAPDAFDGISFSQDPEIPDPYAPHAPPPRAAAAYQVQASSRDPSGRVDGYDASAVCSWISETTGLELPATPVDAAGRGEAPAADPFDNASARRDASLAETVSRTVFPPVATTSYAPPRKWPPAEFASPAPVQRVNFDTSPLSVCRRL